MKTQMNKWIKKIKKVDTISSTNELEQGIYKAIIILSQGVANTNELKKEIDFIITNYIITKGNL